MHELTPSAVAIADRILIAVWIANFQISLFFIVFDVLISHWLIFKGHTEITENTEGLARRPEGESQMAARRSFFVSRRNGRNCCASSICEANRNHRNGCALPIICRANIKFLLFLRFLRDIRTSPCCLRMGRCCRRRYLLSPDHHSRLSSGCHSLGHHHVAVLACVGANLLHLFFCFYFQWHNCLVFLHGSILKVLV